MKDDKTKKVKRDSEMVEGKEELTDKEKAMYRILWGRDWDEDYPSKSGE